MKALEQALGKLIRFLHIYQNIVIGAVVIAFSAFMLNASASIMVIASSATSIDHAAFLPRIVFGLLIFVSVLFIIMGIRQIPANRSAAPEGEALEKTAKETLRSLGALAMLFVYIFCFSRLGFVISSVIYMAGLMLYMTKKESRKPLLFVVIAVAMTLIVYFCFKKFLYIYLPNGILKGVF